MWRNILQETAQKAPPPGATEDVPDSTNKEYKQLLNERVYLFLKSSKTKIHRQ